MGAEQSSWHARKGESEEDKEGSEGKKEEGKERREIGKDKGKRRRWLGKEDRGVCNTANPAPSPRPHNQQLHSRHLHLRYVFKLITHH